MTTTPMTNGFLAIVSTPIGNLSDITFRAIEILRNADLIAAEDTRRARKLLNHYEIKCSLTSYNKDNEARKTDKLLDEVNNGLRIVLLSDAGTPCISDPGYLLVREARRRGIDPLIIPGVSAVTFAAAACGLPLSTFCFAGFLSRKKLKRRTQLKNLLQQNDTVILFESPHRINRLLLEIVEEIGAKTRVAMIREATKRFEEHLYGSAEDLLEQSDQKIWKGEFTIVISTKKYK